MIPKILHRVIPEQTTPLMDRSWESVQRLLPDWEHVTHYDNERLPITGNYLRQCPHGAFRADLIRLESLYIHGGVYLDSDIELVKPIDHLLDTDFFAARENETAITNSVLGSIKGNKILIEAINLSVQVLRKNNFHIHPGADRPIATPSGIAFGPYVMTEIHRAHPEITVLDTKLFFPYSYAERHDTDNKYPNDQEVLGVHRWAGSWRK